MLALFPLDELAKDSQIAHAINFDTPKEVDEFIQIIANVGGHIFRGASNPFWGGRIAYFSDPGHNLREVTWNPSVVFDERVA